MLGGFRPELPHFSRDEAVLFVELCEDLYATVNKAHNTKFSS